MTRKALKENVKCWHKMIRKAPKISTMVGENFEICWHKMTRKAPKIIHHMEGENFEICWHIFEIFLK